MGGLKASYIADDYTLAHPECYFSLVNSVHPDHLCVTDIPESSSACLHRQKKPPQKKQKTPAKTKKNGKAMGAMRTLVILGLSCGGTGKFPLSWWIFASLLA
jgi:hypothetical protein